MIVVNTILDKKMDKRVYQLEDLVVVMAESGSSFKNFTRDNDTERFTIESYQFEPRIDSDKADSNPEKGMSADESDIETTNPRLQNSDWYMR